MFRLHRTIEAPFQKLLQLISLSWMKMKPAANDSDGNRTRVTAVKGRCLNLLTTEPRFHFSLPSISELIVIINRKIQGMCYYRMIHLLVLGCQIGLQRIER